jgi:hypothetical protein
MRSIHAPRCCIALLLLWCGSAPAVVAAPPPGLPPLAQRLVQPLPGDGLSVFESIDTRLPQGADFRTARPLVLRRWDPATGAVSEVALDATGFALAATRTPAGHLFVHLTDPAPASGEAMHAMLLRPDGSLVRGGPLVSRSGARWVRLADGSALLLGGRGDTARSRAVEWLRWRDGALQHVRLPDHPGAGESAFAAVGLADGRLLLTGGTDGEFRGCMPCTAQTWLLDPAAARWTSGPPMQQARAGHSATLLPDGSVLIAGGWTPTEDWSAGPTRRTERWHPGGAGFASASPLLNGSADHHVVPLPGDGDRLLLGGGTATTLQVFDPQRGQWRSAGASDTSRDGSCHLLPLRHAGRLWVWHGLRGAPQYGVGSCGVDDGLWSLRPLHAAAAGDAATFPATGDGYRFDRAAGAFVPLQDERPALLVGGTAGEDAQTQSAAVDAIFADGSVRAYPPLVHARVGAFAARVGRGVLVWGGSDGAANLPDDSRRVLPAEWLDEALPVERREWMVLPTPALRIISLGRDAADRLVVLGARGEVLRVGVATDGDGWPRMVVERLPDVPVRLAPDSPGERQVAIRGLADGRIVVAGGIAPSLRIARWRPDDADPTQADEYLGIGPPMGASTAMIFEPATGRWRESTPAAVRGGRAVILGDGAVFKLASELQPATVDASGAETAPSRWIARIERSAADGGSWTPLAVGDAVGLDLGNASIARPFVVDGTLLLAAEGDVPTGGAPGMVLRLDPGAGPAQVLWRARTGDNWRLHVGRVVHRVGADGRGFVFPVAGE